MKSRPKILPSTTCAALVSALLLCSLEASAQNWIQVAVIDSVPTTSIVEHQGALYASTDSLVFTSTDGGTTWAECPAQPVLSAPLTRLFAIGAYVYAGTLTDGIFRTADSGYSWSAYSTGLATLPVMGLVALGDSIYCGTDGSGVFVRRLSASASWSSYNTGLSLFGVTSLGTSGTQLVAGIALSFFVRAQGSAAWTETSIDSTGAQRLLYETAMQGAYLFAGTSRGVYRSGLDAQSWHKTDIQAFPDQDVVALWADGARLYAGLNYNQQHWIWYSDSAGTNWQIQAHEFAELADLTVASARLWAARTDGLWYWDVPTGVDDGGPQRPTLLSLAPGYPNPFNGSTQIEFSLAEPAVASLRVYDALGRRVATLHQGFKAAGVHRVLWDGRTDSGREAASGVYFCLLEGAGARSTRKLLLLR